jgi:hypothetical protein
MPGKCMGTMASRPGPQPICPGRCSRPLLSSIFCWSLLQVSMRTNSDCRLGISYLPWFSYDARNGGGSGSATWLPNGKIALEFDAQTLIVPPLETSTTRISGAPLPPLLQINIHPRQLAGWLDPSTGEVLLQYDAQFVLSAPLYHPPPLMVRTLLTTGAPLEVQELISEEIRESGGPAGGPDGLQHAQQGAIADLGLGAAAAAFWAAAGAGEAAAGAPLGSETAVEGALRGSRMDRDGHVTLVGVAAVPRTGHRATDVLLRLPAEATAVLSAQFQLY